MILFLVAALLFSAPAPEPVTDDDVFLELVGSFSQPLYVTAPDGDERLFVVERGGRVQVVVDDQVVSTYLDVSHLLPSSLGGEQGLLGLAFHPDFASNGKLYIAYTNSNGDVVIAELVADPQANTVDISTRRTILINEQPFTNHNGGMVLFGPDGYLYIGSGDGGSGGDPDENGQNTSTILGALLRIDVDGDDFPGDSTRNYAVPADNPFVGESGADEIWVYGLRNPWRFWIDPPTGQLFIGDVGQNDWEEVTVLEPGSEGANLGWDILEGTHCFEPPTGCSSAGTVLPQIEYPHDPNASVTGGVVYRGSRIPQLRGTYFYADFLQDFVRSFRFDGSVTEHLDWSSRFDVNQVSSFGTDGFGEMYIVSLAGPVYRVRGPLDNDEIFFYRGDGTFRYYDIAPDASLGAPILSGSGYSPGWSSITAVNLDGDGTDEMFFYRDHDGAYRYYETQPDGSLGTRIRAGDSGYSLGWSSITAVDLDGDGQDEMFFYRDHDGAYRYYDIQPDASLGALLKRRRQRILTRLGRGHRSRPRRRRPRRAALLPGRRHLQVLPDAGRRNLPLSHLLRNRVLLGMVLDQRHRPRRRRRRRAALLPQRRHLQVLPDLRHRSRQPDPVRHRILQRLELDHLGQPRWLSRHDHSLYCEKMELSSTVAVSITDHGRANSSSCR